MNGFYKDAYHDKFLDLIRRFRAENKVVVSIRDGILPVGKSGILQGKNGITYNSDVRREALNNFGVNVVNEPIVLDDYIITSWNPSTAIDVALLLLELLTNKKNAEYVRYLMGS